MSLSQSDHPLALTIVHKVSGAVLVEVIIDDDEGISLTGSDLREAQLAQAALTGATLARAHLERALLHGASLREACCIEADLTDADLTDADLAGADLRFASLRGARLCRADLRGANLSGADLRGADFSEAQLDDAKLVEVEFDDDTTWPLGEPILTYDEEDTQLDLNLNRNGHSSKGNDRQPEPSAGSPEDDLPKDAPALDDLVFDLVDDEAGPVKNVLDDSNEWQTDASGEHVVLRGSRLSQLLEPRSSSSNVNLCEHDPGEDRPRFQPLTRPLTNVDWELSELLGHGRGGECWRAVNPQLPHLGTVLLKFAAASAGAGRVQLVAEAQQISRLTHEAPQAKVVRLQTSYLNHQPACLQYEDLGGLTLESILRQGALVVPEEVLDTISQIASTLSLAHSLTPAIVHGALVPGNVILRMSAAGPDVRLANFAAGPFALGSQQPEPSTPSPREDVLALGRLWYACLKSDPTAVPPAAGVVTEAVAAGYSPGQGRVLSGLLGSDGVQPLPDGTAAAHELEEVR